MDRFAEPSARLTPLTDTPVLDAQVLLAHVLDKPRSWVLAHPETSLTPKQERVLEKALRQLEGGAPLPYVLGKWEFFGLGFEVTPEVLIPRPETELLVERALAWLQPRLANRLTLKRQADIAKSAEADWGTLRATMDCQARDAESAQRLAMNRQASDTKSAEADWGMLRAAMDRQARDAESAQRLVMNCQASDTKSAEADWGTLRAIDVGTGSGCIAIALAVNAPEIQVIATDVSPAALTVARRNAEKYHVADRVAFIEEADLFPDPLSPTPLSPYSLILANLPYIPTATLHHLPVYGREPTLALDGGLDGLDIIRRFLAGAPRHLAPGGLILLEIEASQGAQVLSLAHDAFPEARIGLHQDLSGHDRLVEIQLKDEG